MLISLHVENFALVDSLDLLFGNGLNVLTGETGAGKSIILDAIDAVLGGRVSGRIVRAGSDRGLIEARFALVPELGAWLTAQEIESVEDGVMVCRRELTAGRGGVRNRSRVNGMLVNKQQIESLRQRLVEITAQGQTVQLGEAALQRRWLDGFGGPELQSQLAVVAEAYGASQAALKALERRKHQEAQRQQQLDLFTFQAKELQEANLDNPDELDHLEQERKRLSHAVELQQYSYQAYQLLYQADDGSDACADLLGRAHDTLTTMAEYDTTIVPMLEMLNEALAHVEETGRQINAYGEVLETDPQRLSEVEERIVQLKQICRKYGPTLGEAIARDQQLQTELEALNDGGQSMEALEQAHQVKQAKLVEACAQLTQLRQAAAQQLQDQIISQLKPLAMDKVQFQVAVSPVSPTVSGADRITFMFSPNPGEPLQPLSETASGGEMSRFLLALKVCLSQADAVGTMIFDEIDAGVSGRVAQAIAEKLHQLSHRHQVLCVTHQPIVAAMADNHFHVSKAVVGDGAIATPSVSPPGTKRRAKKAEAASEPAADDIGSKTASDAVRTVVRVMPLDQQQRREELAQLAGGKSDQQAIAFAESLLDQADKTRQSMQVAVGR
ncbi:MAG: DNA repair protein RecN [Elainellaceae cyanobacterium]